MKNICYNLIDHEEIHPIRSWVFLLIIFVLLALLTYIVTKIIVKHRKGNESIKNIDVQNVNIEIEDETEEDKGKNTLNVFRNYKVLTSIVIGQFVIIIGLIAALMIYDDSKSNRMENPSISSSKNIFGIDISHYQGRVDWSEMRTSHHPIEYVFIRATMGIDGEDKHFKEN